MVASLVNDYNDQKITFLTEFIFRYGSHHDGLTALWKGHVEDIKVNL